MSEKIKVKAKHATSLRKGIQIPSKKRKILDLFEAGTHDIEAIASQTGAKKSYVASVLSDTGKLEHYFDLYTHTAYPMNVYSKEFGGKLHFKSLASARQSIDYLEERYQHFQQERDYAGQHHCLLMALTMFNRARWSSKIEEAELYRAWLLKHMEISMATAEDGLQGTPTDQHDCHKSTAKSVNSSIH